MSDGDSILALALFWIFAGITTFATFMITAHHRGHRQALLLAVVSLALFSLLFFGLRVLLAPLSG